MSLSESKSVFARRVGAAACAGWVVFAVGFVLQLIQGVAYLAVVHSPSLTRLVASVWGVGPRQVHIVWLVFVALMKFVLFLWAGACLFLTVWARRLNRAEGEAA